MNHLECKADKLEKKPTRVLPEPRLSPAFRKWCKVVSRWLAPAPAPMKTNPQSLSVSHAPPITAKPRLNSLAAPIRKANSPPARGLGFSINWAEFDNQFVYKRSARADSPNLLAFENAIKSMQSGRSHCIFCRRYVGQIRCIWVCKTVHK